MEIKDKLNKEKETLEKLYEKRNTINEKIKEVEERIEHYTMLLERKEFSEANNVLSSKGLSLDEILKAVREGDLLSLQEKIEKNITTENTTNNDES